MEDILAKLLVADNSVIQQGTQELREAFKNPDVIPALCGVVGSSPNPQIRQYAAVLLRKRLSKARMWVKLPLTVRNGIKEGILQALVNEPEKYVKNSIAQFVAVVMKHEVPKNGWPEVLHFIQQLIVSENLADRELGTYTLSVVSEMAPEAFSSHQLPLAQLFPALLNGTENLASPVAYYTVMSMTHFVSAAETPSLLNTYHQLLPRTMEVVRALSVTNEDQAVECMDLFEELVETAITVIVPHLRPVTEMCLEFASNKDLGEALRVKAVNLIGWITRTKKKAVVKLKLVPPILAVLFKLMSAPPDNEEQEEYFVEDSEANTPTTCATQTLDVLALHLPPDRLLPPLLQHIEPALQGGDRYAKKAAFLALAVVAEGCAERIRTKYLAAFLDSVCEGIRDSAGVVRNAALFALGQFSEHLQPDISQFAVRLVPVLLDYLGHVCEGAEPPGLDRMFYALEMYCENLGEELQPYLATLVERLFSALAPTRSIHLRELAISALGATASAAKERMAPYFPQLIEHLKVYLTQEHTDETLCLKVQAVDTLAVLARAVGPDLFRPLASESLQLGLKLVSDTDDPDLRKATYELFASVASVVREEMAAILPTVVELMLNSLKSSDGIVPHYKEEESAAAFPVYEEPSEDEEDLENASEEDDDDEEVAGFSVENAYMEEKEEACTALRELANHTGPAFTPYLEQCFQEVYKLVNYPQEDIRKASLNALVQFCVNLSKLETREGGIALMKSLRLIVPKCSELIHVDEERAVVMEALDAYTELLKEVGSAVVAEEGHCQAIVNCIRDVMAHKTECQDRGDGDEGEAEQDELLVECAGDVLPNLGRVIPPDEYAMCFEELLPLFVAMTKKQNTVSERSFTIGTLAECAEHLAPHVGKFLPQLLPMFLGMTRDESPEVRNNAIFGMGELVYHGGECTHIHFGDILGALSSAAAKEVHGGTLDNICGALARLIISNVSRVPMEQVFPVFVKYLPLREDFDENKRVYECIQHLYKLGHPQLRQCLSEVVKAAVQVIQQQQGDQETLQVVTDFLKNVQRDFPNEFSSVLSNLPQTIDPASQGNFST